GHYGIGSLDEYFTYHFYTRLDTICTVAQGGPDSTQASIMGDQRTSSELCADSNHNTDTFQGEVQGRSGWSTLRTNWNGGATWSIRTPMDRGSVDPGPFNVSCPANQG